jgi:hypothetical protein
MDFFKFTCNYFNIVAEKNQRKCRKQGGNSVKSILLQIILWLAGYRKYTFRLFTGDVITLRTRSRKEAIQKALNLERRIRADQEKARANRERIIRTLMDGEEIGRQGPRTPDVPGELVKNVLTG